MVEVYSPVGADVTRAHSTPQFKLGSRARASDGQEYLYVQTSGAVALYHCVCIDEDFVARPTTSALAILANAVGWAQNAFTDGQYGWVCVGGANFKSRVKNAVGADAQLYTSSSAGVLGTDASTGNPCLVQGVRTAAAEVSGSTIGASGFVAEIVAVNPHFGSPAS